MQLQKALRELLRSSAGKGGVGLLFLLVGASVYVLVSFPLNFGTRVWSNPNLWVDNPKNAPPIWTNLLHPQPAVQHSVFETYQPDEVATVRAGKIHLYRFSLEHPYNQPPTFLALTLGNVSYQDRAPLVVVSLLRPDGREVRLYRHAVRGPREGEIGPFVRYAETPLRVQLSTDESTVSALREFLAAAFNLAVDERDLLGKVDRALFGTPETSFGTQDDELRFVPLPGQYEIIVRSSFRDERDELGLVRFVVGGGVYGWMGTDTIGRDLAQGLLFGLPVALFIGIVAATLSTAIGTSLGIASGYLGGRADLLIQRLSDIVANIPVLPLLIFMLFVIGPSLFVIILILVAFGWPGLTIQIRAMVLHMRTNALVEAIQSLGASRRRVMFRHILPQIAPYVLAQLIFSAPSAILAEAGLSFLGLGDPSIPTWGQILETGFRTGAVYVGYWWWIVPPGLLIILTALTFMLLSLGLEPVINPRLRRSR